MRLSLNRRSAIGLCVGWCFVTFGLQTWIQYGLTDYERMVSSEGGVEGRLETALRHDREARDRFENLIDPKPVTTNDRVKVPDIAGVMRDPSWIQVNAVGGLTMNTNRFENLLYAGVCREGVTFQQARAAQAEALRAVKELQHARNAVVTAHDFNTRLWLSWVLLTALPIIGLWCWMAVSRPSANEQLGSVREESVMMVFK